MINSAVDVEPNAFDVLHSPGTANDGERSSTMNSSNCRFPPVEHALFDIIKNKRLEGTQKDN